MTIRALIESVERGEFITGVLQSHETVAYAAFSGSLDAALALHEALLPGWAWEVASSDAASVFKGHVIYGPCELAASETTARAWLLAILRAVEAEGQP